VCGRTAGLYGLGEPRGLSGRIPFCLSLKETGGAKSAASNTIEFSVSFAGVGSDDSADGGGRGFFGGGSRPLIDDMPRGGGYCDEAIEPLDMCGPPEAVPVLLRKRGGARGGGVMARRVIGSAKGALG
jgi:hypothetical protein